MLYELFLARRYLRSKRKHAAARLTAAAAGFGIACGVAALIIATSLANGFRDELQDKILRGTAHISLTAANGVGLQQTNLIVERINKIAGVRQASQTTYTGAMLVANDTTNYAVVRGIESNATGDLRGSLIAGRFEDLFAPEANEENAMSVIIGSELAARANMNIGDAAIIVTSGRTNAASNSHIASQPTSQIASQPSLNLGTAFNIQTVRVVGVFNSGLHDYDAAWIYAALPRAVSLAGNMNDAPNVISIELTNAYDAAPVAALVKRAAEEASSETNFNVVTWQQANAELFAALELERRTVAGIILLVTIIATLNILTTLVLLVVERRHQIAVLRAMGARARSIMFIFVAEGATLGLIGTFAGCAIGLAACWFGNRFRLVSLPVEVYSLSYVPLHTRLTDVVIIVFVALIISLLATIYPARAAANVQPAQALREQ